MLFVCCCVLVNDMLKLKLKLLLIDDVYGNVYFICCWYVSSFVSGVCDMAVSVMLWCVRCMVKLLKLLVSVEYDG